MFYSSPYDRLPGLPFLISQPHVFPCGYTVDMLHTLGVVVEAWVNYANIYGVYRHAFNMDDNRGL